MEMISTWFTFFPQAMKDAVGLPVTVQVMTLSHRDELCLRIMKEIEGSSDYKVYP